VRRVFALTAQDPSIPDLTATLDAKGRFVLGLPAASPDAHPRYVVAAEGVQVVGTKLGAAGQLVLWRVRPPLRLESLASGVTPDGWTGATAAYLRYQVPAGATHVTVSLARTGLAGLPAARVRATVGPLVGSRWENRTVTVPGGGGKLLRLPLRGHEPFRVDLAVSPTFSPSQFGLPDTRTLGVRASFSVG
jgi:hypothetical protein